MGTVGCVAFSCDLARGETAHCSDFAERSEDLGRTRHYKQPARMRSCPPAYHPEIDNMRQPDGDDSGAALPGMCL